MGFRSYLRQFSGAMLMLSVLHCHGDLLLGVVRFLASQLARSLKSSFSMGFRRYIGQFSGAILMLSILHCHGDLLLGVVRFFASLQSFFFYRFQKSSRSRSSSSSRRKQEEKVAKIIFLWVSEVTLGSFWAQF